MQNPISIKNEYRTAAIIAGGMVAALFAYAAVVEVLIRQHEIFKGFHPQMNVEKFRDGLLGVAFVVFIAIRGIRKSILKKKDEDGPQALANKLKIATIATFALSEVPAIFGLVLFLMGGLHKEFYISFLYSCLLMTLYFPRYQHWDAWIRGRTLSSFY